MGRLFGVIWICGAAACLAADFGDGFAQFRQLGLPDVAEAEYVRVEDRSGYRRESPVSREGNAWLLPGESRRVVLEEARVVKMEEHVESKAADLQRDVKTVVKYLEGVKSMDEDYEFGQQMPQLFCFAAHAHRQGFREEAGRMVELMSRAAGGSRKVIGAALNHLGNQRYLAALAGFARNGDTNAFTRDLEELLGQIPEQWSVRPAVARVLEAVSDRSERRVPEDELAQALVASKGVTAEQEMLAQMTYRPWVLSPADPEGGEGAVIARITARGVDAIPMLVEWLESEALTPLVDLQSAHVLDHSRGVLSGSDLERVYQSMPRPLTLADVARKLLVGGLGDDELNDPSISNREIAEAARVFHQENAGKSGSEIARALLESDDEEEQRKGFELLLRSGDSADAELAAAKLLEWPVTMESLQRAHQIAVAMGETGGAFAEKFVARMPEASVLVAEQYPGLPEEHRKQTEEHVRQQVKMLEQFAKPMPLEELVREIAAGREPAGMLQAAASSQSTEEVVRVLFEAIAETEDPDELFTLLTIVSGQGREGGENIPEKLVQGHEAAWRRLLESEAVPAGSPAANWTACVTVGDWTAAILEMLFGGEVYSEVAQIGNAGGSAMEFLRKRAVARLEGETDLPPLPDGKEVTEERREAIGKELEGAGALEESRPAWSANETLVLPEIVQSGDGLNAKLEGVANRVGRVLTPGLEKVPAELPAIGTALDAKGVQKLEELVRKEAEAGRALVVQVRRTTSLEGVTIVAARPDAERLRQSLEQMGLPGNEAFVYGSAFVWGQDQNANANAQEILAPDEEGHFDAAIEKALASGAEVTASLSIVLTGVPAGVEQK